MKHSNRAFTLIELLVVIAIIAILAAILFPVFAQAKVAAKKAAAISNYKQTGTSVAIYLADADDLYPQAYVPIAGTPSLQYYVNGAGTPSAALIPEMNIPAYGFLESEDGQFWANSTRPYRKNDGILDADNTIRQNYWIAGVNAAAPKPMSRINVNMNGFLNTYSATAVASPSRAVLFWQGFGNWSFLGGSFSNPYLLCRGTGPCVYNPTGSPQAGVTGSFFSNMSFYTGMSQYVFGRNSIFVSTDTSCRTVAHPAPSTTAAPAASFRFDPYRRYNSAGTGLSPYYCGTLSWECTFQPDREF